MPEDRRRPPSAPGSASHGAVGSRSRGPTAVILAAGAGSRLGEIGRRFSKAMLPVAGRPLIAWVVDRLRAGGAERLVVVGHDSDAALAGLVAGLDDAILVRQSERRGIAAALRLALPSLAGVEAYLACACDSLFDAADIAAVIALGRKRGQAAVVGVLEMGAAATATRSAVRIDGERVVEIVEKPAPGSVSTGLVSMPLYWLPASFSAQLSAPSSTAGEEYVSTALAAFVAAGGELLAHRVRRRLEITTPEDIALVERALLA
jgi:NDP-sugar pyrophosphorylase family protein